MDSAKETLPLLPKRSLELSDFLEQTNVQRFQKMPSSVKRHLQKRNQEVASKDKISKFYLSQAAVTSEPSRSTLAKELNQQNIPPRKNSKLRGETQIKLKLKDPAVQRVVAVDTSLEVTPKGLKIKKSGPSSTKLEQPAFNQHVSQLKAPIFKNSRDKSPNQFSKSQPKQRQERRVPDNSKPHQQSKLNSHRNIFLHPSANIMNTNSPQIFIQHPSNNSHLKQLSPLGQSTRNSNQLSNRLQLISSFDSSKIFNLPHQDWQRKSNSKKNQEELSPLNNWQREATNKRIFNTYIDPSKNNKVQIKTHTRNKPLLIPSSIISYNSSKNGNAFSKSFVFPAPKPTDQT